MAQVIFPLGGVTPVTIPGSAQGVTITDGAHIYESVASPIGVGANSAYVAAYMQTIGGPEAETIAGKIIELFVNYTDGTRVSLGRTAVGGSAFPTAFAAGIHFAAHQWWEFRANGTMALLSGAPTAATVVPQNAAAGSRARLPVDASKTISFLRLWIAP